MKRVAFHTLGCKTNQYDTQAMREQFISAGWLEADFNQPAEVYIVNTCTVTSISDQKSRQMLRRAARRGLVVAAGCLAQREPEAMLAIDGVALVIGTDDRHHIVSLVDEALEGKQRRSTVTPNDSHTAYEELSISGSGPLARANLKIQEGCSRFCSYCTIPLVRGPARSRSLKYIVQEAQHLREAGCRELVLTGIHLASYGNDLADIELIDVLEALDLPGSRLRLGSLEPLLITEAFVDRLAKIQTLCPQFHLSLQSGSLNVLRRMNRQYTPEQYEQAVRLLRDALPGCAITTDVMTGFPGETELEHQESLTFVEKMAFTRAHIFPYSVRPGTAAAGMSAQIPKLIREQRGHDMGNAAAYAAQAFRQSQIGRIQQVLVEHNINGQGTTQHSLTARVIGTVKPGMLVNAKCHRIVFDKLICEIIEEV